MKEELISFDTAKLAKEKGFPQRERFRFDDIAPYYSSYKGERITSDNYEQASNDINNTIEIEKPTQSLLQKWLREEHDIHVCIDISLLKQWYVNIYNIKSKPSEFEKTYKILDEVRFNTYEEALEVGLLEALKLIK